MSLPKAQNYISIWGFPGGSRIKNLPEMQKTPWVQPMGQEDPLKEGMATHSSILASENPMDRGACQGTVHRIAQSQTPLKQIHMQAIYLLLTSS